MAITGVEFHSLYENEKNSNQTAMNAVYVHNIDNKYINGAKIQWYFLPFPYFTSVFCTLTFWSNCPIKYKHTSRFKTLF